MNRGMTSSNLKIIMLQGLPGSGKSTVARQIVGNSADKVIISKDAIRRMFGIYWCPEREPLVKLTADTVLFAAMMKHCSTIVIDSCNLGNEEAELIDIACQYNEKLDGKYELQKVEVVTPLRVCLERLKARDVNEEQPITEDVVRDMVCSNDINVCKLYEVPVAELCKQHGIKYIVFDGKFTIEMPYLDKWHEVLWQYLLSQQEV